MDTVVKGRNQTISDSFRSHIEDKVAKVEQFASRALRVEVQVTNDPHVKDPENSERVEITVIGKGRVLRAEAHASDKYAALDLAWAKLLERLRRARDRQKTSRQGRHRNESTAEVLAKLAPAETIQEAAIDAEPEIVVEEEAAADPTGGRIRAEGDSPVVLREKNFPATPIGIEEALNRMEMVGHDFYLYIDEESGKPSVVYRRKGWSYGVIALDKDLDDATAE